MFFSRIGSNKPAALEFSFYEKFPNKPLEGSFLRRGPKNSFFFYLNCNIRLRILNPQQMFAEGNLLVFCRPKKSQKSGAAYHSLINGCDILKL